MDKVSFCIVLLEIQYLKKQSRLDKTIVTRSLIDDMEEKREKSIINIGWF